MAERKSVGLFNLFLLFVKIGLVTIGGGYVMIPLLQKEFVDKRKLMETREFCDVMAIAQAGPGGVAINSSTVVGYKLAGIPGAVIATLGTILPSFVVIILLAIYLAYAKDSRVLKGFLAGASPAVVGVLLVGAYSLGKEVIEDLRGAFLAAGSFVAVIFFNIHPVLVIIIAGVCGYFCYRNKVRAEEESCGIR